MKKLIVFFVVWMIMTSTMFSQTQNTLKRSFSYPTNIDESSYLGTGEGGYHIAGDFEDLPQSSTSSKLKGNVKTLKVTEFKGRMKFGEFQIQGIQCFSIFLFNEEGFLIEKKDYDADNKLIDQLTYKYDEKGNHIECNNHLYISFEKGDYFEDFYLRPIIKSTNTYNDKGNHIESNSYNLDGSLRFKSINKFDNNGNFIEKNNYNSGGDLISKSVYTYDTKGNITIINSNNFPNESYLVIENICKYNANGNLFHKHFSNFTSVDYFYEYDEKGNLVKELPDGYSDVITYKYEYDETGNWIKKSTFKGNIQSGYREREIKYY